MPCPAFRPTTRESTRAVTACVRARMVALKLVLPAGWKGPILALHVVFESQAMASIRFRIDLTPGCSIGPGKIQLLEAVARTGSLRRAATELRMSYRRAWLLLDEINHSFSEPATLATVGGAGG